MIDSVVRRVARLATLFLLTLIVPINLAAQSKAAQPQQSGDSAAALVQQGQDFIRTRQFNDAIEVLRKAIQVQPNLAVAHVQLGIALLGANQRDEAMSEVKRAIELDPNDARAYVAQGNIDSSMRRYDEAIAAYKQAVNLDSNYLNAYMNLGMAYGTTQRFADSAEAFQQALRLDPNNASALNGLGIAQFRTGQREEGIQSVKQAIRINPGFVDAHLNLARWYHGMGQYKQAVAEFTEVTRILPKWPQTYFERTTDNFYLGLYDAAASDARTFLDLTDWHSDRAQYMAIFGSISYRRAGKPTEAKEILDLAAKRSNQNSWPYRIISYLRGEFPADALVGIASSSNDRLTEAHGYIGLDLLLKDQKEAALTHLKWVKEHGNRNFVEYIFSTIELNRLENGKQ